MDEKKQKLEIANDIVNAFGDGKCKECMWYDSVAIAHAEALYNAGYRKQSEGEWEKRTYIIFDSEKIGYHCSECNTTWDTPTNYCPNCGAKMKGGAEK
jgi:rubrerythrin